MRPSLLNCRLRASTFRTCLCLLILCLGLAHPTLAGSPNPDRFPLRVYIFRYANQPDRSHDSKHPADMPDFIAGMGQADVFESGGPRGFQFIFSCTVPMQASGGHATFPARWKRREKTLEILLPQKGKPENLEPCELQLEWIPGLAYFWKNGAIAAGPPAPLVDWMKKHRFDPENGGLEPILLPGDSNANDPFLAPE